MADKDLITDDQRLEVSPGSLLSVQSGALGPLVEYQAVLHDGTLSLVPLDSHATGEGVVQPYPRSPKLLRKVAASRNLSEEQLSRRLEELQSERTRTKAHIQSLKKRKADLSRSTEVMKHQVRERVEGMRAALQRDQQAMMDSLELDRIETSARLDHVLKGWDQHLGQVQRSITTTQKSLGQTRTGGDKQNHPDDLSHKKPDASEAEIRLNEERFEKLLKTLRSFHKDLKAQLQRKTLLLDSFPVMMDRQTCHSKITVTGEGRGMCFSDFAQSSPEHPLQFDKVCCALGSVAVTTGQRYWEADVRCCSAWAVGVAYGCLDRKGRDKGAKLGRNRNSWCVELRHGRLSAWHNDRHVSCSASGRGVPGRVGVWVHYEKGKLAFYDAETMKVLQEFSAALTTVFDRVHHQFTEPLYPAFCFLRPSEGQVWPSHMEIRDINTPIAIHKCQ
ncbi:tripartite motif-containing protein 14 [Oncorhynchus tshawytscha]|uniref:B30.2/SPRY domain-containing protein n=1 Tax=Oncorhynchus tshawytscha TaxID=74940 RepID=A0A8C8ME25_ONCTS|nr:tripartite motif-containing protein 14 [Oncorhynchus tshawytscha]XP_024229612.1 tripartite motif-containing protein 14 [Oncorhynchus tshawytscha]